jgi:hypothetical protein
MEHIDSGCRAATLAQAGRRTVPALSERLSRSNDTSVRPRRAAAVRQAHELMAKENFSCAVLVGCGDMLAVSRLPRMVWSDLGSPDRVNGCDGTDANSTVRRQGGHDE